jgi:hypothetical protein
MTFTWFRPWGWLFRPASVAGWLALSLAVVFCIQVYLAIDQHSHSASDTFYGVFPYFACTFLLLDWVAARTGGTRCRSR